MATIFIDRDGVINENRSDYVKSWQEFHFLPESREAIAQLTYAGHRIVVCTNQAAIARGIVSVDTVEEIHHRMLTDIAQAGGFIEKIYYCPHSKYENCFCRKPRPGMLLRARDDLGINMKDAIFIGDSITDVRAGIAAGVRSILVLTGLGVKQLCEHSHEAGGPFYVARNLKYAANFISQMVPEEEIAGPLLTLFMSGYQQIREVEYCEQLFRKISNSQLPVAGHQRHLYTEFITGNPARNI